MRQGLVKMFVDFLQLAPFRYWPWSKNLEMQMWYGHKIFLMVERSSMVDLSGVGVIN